MGERTSGERLSGESFAGAQGSGEPLSWLRAQSGDVRVGALTKKRNAPCCELRALISHC